MRSHIWLLISGIDPNVCAFRLDRDVMIVGRNASCDIQIIDAKVSRIHARIERSNAKWHIIDRGSTNGTYLNGERIKQAEIHTGDTLQMGRTNLIVANGTDKHPDLEFDGEDKTPRVTPKDCAIIQNENGQLTEKQMQVAALLREGLSRKEIATEIGIADSTVDTHIKHIFAALGVHSHPQLMSLKGDQSANLKKE